MEYIGASDYFFWLGVENGYQWPKTDYPGKAQDMFYFVSKAALEAFNGYTWGFCLGLILTEDEYNELTNPVKPAIIVDTRQSSVAYVDLEGNC